MEDLMYGFYDGPHATPKSSDNGPIFLGIKNITDDGRLDFTNIRHISNEEYPKWTKRVIPQKGDIVFSYEATLHRYAIIPNGFIGCLGRRMALVRVNDKVDFKFLYYYFFSNLWRNEVNNYVLSGATVDRIPLTKFPDFKLSIPPLQTQNRIADTLSAYDNLIENNLKRIKVLEQAAQNIYKEWFVNLRFPGHDNTVINEETGLPEGWENSELDLVATVQSSKRVFLTDYVDDGVPFFRGKEISQKVKHENVSEPYFISQEKFKEFDSKWGSPKENDILITAVGTIGNCYLVRESDLPFYFKDGNLLWIHSYSQKISSLYVIQYFQSPIFKGVLNSISIGSSQKALTISAVKKINITIPDIETLEKFNFIIMPIIKQIEVMTNMMIQLKAARDILLPRLMNRTIEV
jgi:type I restriction enzyme S subunit